MGRSTIRATLTEFAMTLPHSGCSAIALTAQDAGGHR
jgi:hypothetical protein